MKISPQPVLKRLLQIILQLKLFQRWEIMRAVLSISIIVFLLGCGQENPPTNTDSTESRESSSAQDTKTDAQKTPAPEPVLVLTDPESVAKAVLKAYQNKDLNALASLSNSTNQEIFSELAEAGEQHPRYQSIFKGERMEAVNQWDGKIQGVRYRNDSTAAVAFGKINENELAVVMLTWEENNWAFEDINSPSRNQFESLPKTRKK